MPARPLLPGWLLFLWFVATAVVVAPWTARGQELVVSRDGQVLRNARVEHVDPDGITYRHNNGDTKLPFEDLPDSVRRAYGFDPKRAADFRRQEAERAETDRRMLAESEARHREALAKRAAELAAAVSANGTGFTYTPGVGGAAGSEAATRAAAAASVAAQMERWEAVRARLTDTTVLGNSMWTKVPLRLAPPIGERRPGEFGNGEDSFFTPNYEKRQFSDLYQNPPGR